MPGLRTDWTDRIEVEDHLASTIEGIFDKDLSRSNCELLAQALVSEFDILPRCTCVDDDGQRIFHTAAEGNWGGHSVSCPRRDYANEHERVL